MLNFIRYKFDNEKRIIFIPVETIARELDYKIVLASNLLSKDNIIFLGQHDFLDSILRNFKDGSYIGKHVFKESFPCPLGLYAKYKKIGFLFSGCMKKVVSMPAIKKIGKGT